MLSTPMTSLNNRLQLALLNRKRGKSALEKGFTLVELMIVIVIVGILSAVALPNFLSQTDKAKLTEAKSLSKGYLTNYHISTLDNTTATAQLDVSSGGACPEDTANFSFDCTTTAGSIIVTDLSDSSTAMTASVSSAGVISGI